MLDLHQRFNSARKNFKCYWTWARTLSKHKWSAPDFTQLNTSASWENRPQMYVDQEFVRSL